MIYANRQEPGTMQPGDAVAYVRLVEGPDPSFAAAFVTPGGSGVAKRLEAWRALCWRERIPIIAVRLLKRHAAIETDSDPKSQGGKMTEEARRLAVDALVAAGACGGVGAFTYARIPLASVGTLVPRLVAIFNAPGAIVTGREQMARFLGREVTTP
jgi:hypothetical protein